MFRQITGTWKQKIFIAKSRPGGRLLGSIWLEGYLYLGEELGGVAGEALVYHGYLKRGAVGAKAALVHVVEKPLIVLAGLVVPADEAQRHAAALGLSLLHI